MRPAHAAGSVDWGGFAIAAIGSITAWLVAGTLLVVAGIWLLARQHAANAPRATAVAPAAPGD